MRTIRQVENSECALACVAMVADHFGHRAELSQLRAIMGPSSRGSTLSQLMSMARELELNSRPVKAEMEDLPGIRLPCILHWDDSHFVVLKSIKRKSFEIVDPARGLRLLSYADVSDHFTGVAVEFTPRSSFKKVDLRDKVDYRRLFGAISGLKRGLAQLIALTVFLEICGLVAPLFSKWMIDSVIPSQDINLFWILTASSIFVLLVRVSTQYVRASSVILMTTQFSLQWGGNLLDKLLRIPLPYFEKRRHSDISSRFFSFNVIQKQLTTGSSEIFMDGLMSIIGVSAMLLLNRSLALLAIGATFAYGLIRVVVYPYLAKLREQSVAQSSVQQAHLLETIQGIFAVRLANREHWRLLHWQNLFNDEISSGVKQQALESKANALNSLLSGFRDLSVTAVGIFAIISNEFTIGELVAFGIYAGVFSQRAVSFIDRLIEVKMLRIHVDRIADFALIDDEEEVEPEKSLNARVSLEPPTIEFRNVYFRYAEGEDFVLNGLSFSIAAGESVAIIGKSGAGKSTLLKLLLGVYVPTHGEILINGIKISRYGIRKFRDDVAAIMQHDTLFNGSIAENISFYDEETDFDLLKQSAAKAAIDLEIEKMPMRYHTRVGDQGASLSGGQRQRVLLARAFYRSAKIFVLDEATSHLDVENEHKVNQSIKASKATRIFVAHRPETIRTADRIIDISAGADLISLSA